MCRGTLRTLPSSTNRFHQMMLVWLLSTRHQNYIVDYTCVIPELDIVYLCDKLYHNQKERLRVCSEYKSKLRGIAVVSFLFIYFLFVIPLSHSLPASRGYALVFRARPRCSTKCVTSSRPPGGAVVSE